MRKSGTCALTGGHDVFVKCHLLPKAIFPEREKTKVADTKAQSRPKRRPVGPYSNELVTRCGEDILERYDDYGIRFLRRQVGQWSLEDDNKYWAVQGLDYARLKLFFISILWRCAAASHPTPDYIDIADQMNTLRDMVRVGDPGPAEFFSVMSENYAYDPDLIPIFPFKTRVEDGRKDHVALLSGFEFYITETWESGITPVGTDILTPDRKWKIPLVDWKSSGRAGIAKQLSEENDAKFPGWMK